MYCVISGVITFSVGAIIIIALTIVHSEYQDEYYEQMIPTTFNITSATLGSHNCFKKGNCKCVNAPQAQSCTPITAWKKEGICSDGYRCCSTLCDTCSSRTCSRLLRDSSEETLSIEKQKIQINVDDEFISIGNNFTISFEQMNLTKTNFSNGTLSTYTQKVISQYFKQSSTKGTIRTPKCSTSFYQCNCYCAKSVKHQQCDVRKFTCYTPRIDVRFLLQSSKSAYDQCIALEHNPIICQQKYFLKEGSKTKNCDTIRKCAEKFLHGIKSNTIRNGFYNAIETNTKKKISDFQIGELDPFEIDFGYIAGWTIASFVVVIGIGMIIGGYCSGECASTSNINSDS